MVEDSGERKGAMLGGSDATAGVEVTDGAGEKLVSDSGVGETVIVVNSVMVDELKLVEG